MGPHEVESIDDSSARVVCHNPYSCALDVGIVRGTAEKFSPPVAIVELEEVSTGCRDEGGHLHVQSELVSVSERRQ